MENIFAVLQILSLLCLAGAFIFIFFNEGVFIFTWTKFLAGILLCIYSVIFFYAFGFRFNLTDSMPKGLYRVSMPKVFYKEDAVSERPERGDLVTFCLESNNPFTLVATERGYIGTGICPNGLKPFLKHLVGLYGDQVIVSPGGIILNGSCLAGTARPERDSQGRLVPPSLLRDGAIPPGQALVISQQHSGSFDSRHFGLVPLESLQKVKPVLTFK